MRPWPAPDPEQASLSSRAWVWLFPLTYLLHVTEERALGFPAWYSHLTGASLTEARFIAINTVAAVFMVAMVGLYQVVGRPAGAIPTALATAITVNGTAHVAASILTLTYSPGAVSGALVWIPLGVTVLRWARRSLPAAMVGGGIALGLVIHAGVTVFAATAR
jgi:hypothetical protein